MAKVYFGTNRNPNRKTKPDDFGRGFSKAGLASLRFGMVEFTGEDLDTYDLYLAPERLPEDAGRKTKDGKGAILGSLNVFDRVRRKMVEHSRDTVIFIHGYNVSFKEALTDAARLKRNFSTAAGGPGVNVYFNNNDRVMAVSDKTKGNPDRLGDDGPRVPRGIPGKVTLIDCTSVVEGPIGHTYDLDTPRVVADMQKVLVGTPADEISGRHYVQETNRYRLV